MNRIGTSTQPATAWPLLRAGKKRHCDTAASAAWSSRANLTIDDIRMAAELALPHRMRRQPFTEVKLDEGRMNAILDRASGEEATENTPSVDGVKKKLR